MLSNVLEKETCAGCRICCSFVKADVWEAPVFKEEEIRLAIQQGVSGDAFEALEKQGLYRARYEFTSDTEILLCPCLHEKKGCLLGDEKPFECSIWPVRIFEDEQGTHLGVAEMCPAFQGNKREKLVHELNDNQLREKILERKQEQLIVKDREEGYTSV